VRQLAVRSAWLPVQRLGTARTALPDTPAGRRVLPPGCSGATAAGAPPAGSAASPGAAPAPARPSAGSCGCSRTLSGSPCATPAPATAAPSRRRCQSAVRSPAHLPVRFHLLAGWWSPVQLCQWRHPGPAPALAGHRAPKRPEGPAPARRHPAALAAARWTTVPAPVPASPSACPPLRLRAAGHRPSDSAPWVIAVLGIEKRRRVEIQRRFTALLAVYRPAAARLREAQPLVQRSTVASHRLRRLPASPATQPARSEEHTSELQSRENLVCRLL